MSRAKRMWVTPGQMNRTTSLPRTKGLTRTPWQRKREPKPKRARNTGPTPATVALVRERDGNRCLRCGATGPLTTQHRKPRQMGGSRDPRINDPANLASLCGDGTSGCHGHVERFRDQARDDGWLLRDVADAPTTPVRSWSGWRLLHDDGYWSVRDEIDPATNHRKANP